MFYLHKQMGDGYLNKCKECAKKDVSLKYKENCSNPDYIIAERKRGRNKYKRLYIGLGKSKPDANLRYFEKFPEKKKASSVCSKLIIEKGMEKHHWSYNEEHFKDIIPLIKKNHMKAHRFIIYDPERKMYRSVKDMLLLDTKEKHLKFISDCIKNEED